MENERNHLSSLALCLTGAFIGFSDMHESWWMRVLAILCVAGVVANLALMFKKND